MIKCPVYLATALLTAATVAPLDAQAVPAAAGDVAAPVSEHAPEIVITAPLSRTREDVIAGVTVLSGAELTRDLKSTVAETLARTPGVSASSFGPSASRPILRGFQGARVRVLTDGIGSFDVSSTSVDHAVVINPLLAERIEVVRGPSALLYGSEAIGGVVNVIDTRIPRTVPSKGFRLSGSATYGSAADERSGGAAADVAVTDQLVIHADGSYLKSNDLHIGGYALSPDLRRQAMATAASGSDPDGGIDFAANASVKNRLPNTAARTWDAGLGASLITSTGNLGIAFSHYDSLYGVPIRYATMPGQEQEAPQLDVNQNRVDLRGEVDTGGGFLKAIRVRAGFADYRHYELEEDGSIGTAFYADGAEGRVELVQQRRGAWSGIVGGQIVYRDFDVVGDEAFLPRNQTTQTGIFTLQQYDTGAWKIEGGARFEHVSLSANPRDFQPQFYGGERQFEAVSGSIGGSVKLSDLIRFGINLSHSERAPSAEELFANGPHGGTEAFEIGDTQLSKERGDGIEAVLHAHGTGFDLEASAYYNRFSNYVDDLQTGALADGLPVYQTLQGKARYYGFEAQGRVTLARIGKTVVDADLLGDYVHAAIVDQGPAPRIPPLRVLGGIEAHGGLLFGRIELERTLAQNRFTDYETRTPGFTLFNTSIGIHPFVDQPGTQLILSGNNLLDVSARRATSFLKDYAPLAGRDIRVTARFAI